jgi:2'-5' RNA ligase
MNEGGARDPGAGTLQAETGIVVVVPQAEPLVQPYRERHDPVAALGMPAHVTLFYPFRAPGDVSEDDLAALGRIAERTAPFSFSLTEVGRFPDVLFLKTEPPGPFVKLASAIADAFPSMRMYEGEHSSYVPHLTVAHAADTRVLDTIAGRFIREAEQYLPIEAFAGHVSLMESRGERWTIRRSFQLGERGSPTPQGSEVVRP